MWFLWRSLYVCMLCLCIRLQIYDWNPSLTGTAVMELFPLFSGHVIVSCVFLEPATPGVLVPHSAESLSTAIIPSKTSAVIPAMFHQSVAIYSKAHCLSMLATTKIIACESLCLCVCVCVCAHNYVPLTHITSCHPCGGVPAGKSLADGFAFLRCYFTMESELYVRVCVRLNN